MFLYSLQSRLRVGDCSPGTFAFAPCSVAGGDGALNLVIDVSECGCRFASSTAVQRGGCSRWRIASPCGLNHRFLRRMQLERHWGLQEFRSRASVFVRGGPSHRGGTTDMLDANESTWAFVCCR